MQPSSSFVLFCRTQRSGTDRQQFVGLFEQQRKLVRRNNSRVPEKFEPEYRLVGFFDHNIYLGKKPAWDLDRQTAR